MILVTLFVKFVTVVTIPCPAGPFGYVVVGAGTERFAFGYCMFSAVFEPDPSGFEGHTSITSQ